jgi:manganese/zinc/iron transport system permease protein
MITIYITIIGLQISFLYSLLGPFLALLKNAFMIDAIGHSIVFGIAAGFLISHSLHSPILFICAILSAFLMNAINQLIQKNKSISQDASLGIAFSTLFSIGILLISLYAKNIHLDLDMILLGNIEYSLYDTFLLFHNWFIPKIIIFLTLAIIFFILFLYFFYDEIHIVLFDKEFAKIKGIKTELINYIFITAMTILIVTTFHAMGSLLLLGIAVAPFGFAWQNNNSYLDFLKEGIFYSIVFSILGIFISLWADTSIAATITFCITSGALVRYYFYNKSL